MDIAINSDNIFYLQGYKQQMNITLDSLDSNGETTFSGLLPDMQRLQPGHNFYIKSKDGDEVIAGTILKISWRKITDVSVFRPDDHMPITMTVDAICSIEKCQYFEEKRKYS